MVTVESKKYSIWLEPNTKSLLYEGLAEIIQYISKKYNSPLFTPHVTLIGNVQADSNQEIIQKMDEFVKKTKPFTQKLTPNLHDSDEYFRALYVEVEKGAELVNAFKSASEFFKMSLDVDSFTPHVSLTYGNFSKSERDKIKEDIEAKVTLLIDSLDSFPVDKMVVYYTTGEVKTWYLVQEFSLSA
eukprot:TRINITY_DN3600_c0_g1_i1.p1 TRINITY_DN3600_c0_g1~~TRINITY_DN3600_c0_g1_i1.p1  ORF type:complete len:186 (-),score=46.52 TRINITY_DN3600_c0_g1_i1:61-618(-)